MKYNYSMHVILGRQSENVEIKDVTFMTSSEITRFLITNKGNILYCFIVDKDGNYITNKFKKYLGE